MQIFNTLTRQKEEFVPQVPGEYRIYVCGPTVYNYIHIGNARPLIVFDTLRRYLEYRGNKVIYVSNITDIDDKLIKKGQEEGTSMKEVAQRFEAEYLKDAAGLNCKKPTVQPRATEHIQQILDIVKDLIESGHAYVAKNGDVYFRVKSDPEYGKLSHLKLDDLESGNRELRSQMEDDLKEDPADFAVWKAAKPGEPAWESPYGMGRPGWHIECSAMSRTHLGKTIDLHCGGQDLIFPHHENEIAQSECANGCEFARYWMHNGFINVDNQKMSKSLHNFFTVRDVANLYGYEPIRYFMLTAGYRMPLNYTVDLIESCKNSLERLYTCRENLDFALSKTTFGTDETLTADIVLSAVGIKSNIEGLGLEELGVRVERDKIAVDEHYRTNVEGVYAVGDIVPGPALAHVASAEALHCVEHICGVESDPVDYSVIPSCVFTSPEVASVGLTEREALAREIPYTVGRYSFMASGKAAAAGERDGFVKLLFDADRKLIGAHLVGASVTEMLAEPTLACRLGATARQIARTIHAHPTMNEGVMEAAAAVPER